MKIISKKIRLVFLFCIAANVLFAQNKEIHGFTVTGIKGIRKSLKEIIIYDAAHPLPSNFKAPLRPELHGPRLNDKTRNLKLFQNPEHY
jgi:hypothetical protein